jgi:NodT family efflux transporter outer membrane factor (OMF) lipoprotein
MRPPPFIGLIIGMVLAGATLAGCVRLAPPEPPALPDAWRNGAFGQRAAGVPEAWPERWWEGFGDPLLPTMVTEARAAGPSVAAAAARLEAARALMRPVEVAGRPRINGSAQIRGDSRLDGRGGGGSLESRASIPTGLSAASESLETDRNTAIRTAGFDASWEIDLFGRLAADRAAGAAEAEIATADLAAVRVTLTSEIVRGFADLRAAQRQTQLLGELAALRERLQALAARRRDAGVGPDAEVERADGARVEAASHLSRQEEAARDALLRLAALAGGATADPRLSTPAEPLRPRRMALASLPADLLRHRPDVRRAEARVTAAAAQVGIAQADMLPRLSLTGSLISGANLIGNQLSGPLTILSGGPGVTIPLFDWGGRRAVRDARVAAWRAAVEDHRLAVLDGYAEAEAAIGRLETASRRTDAAALARDRAARAAARAAKLQEAGLTAEDEAFEAAAAVLSAEIEEAEALRSEAIAVAALFKALGGGAAPL